MKIKNKYLHYTLIIIALAIVIGSSFIPRPIGVTQPMVSIMAIFLACVLLWFTGNLDLSSVLCIVCLGLIPKLGGFKSVFQYMFAENSATIVYIVAVFICSYAMKNTPLIKRIALFLLTNRFAKKGGWAFTTTFIFTILLLGCFISPIALFILLLPVLHEIYKITGIEKGDKAGSMLMLAFIYTISISSGMTPFAHTFAVMVCNVAQISFDYLRYMMIAIPTGIVITLLMLFVLRFILNPDLSALRNIETDKLKEELPALSVEEIINIMIVCAMLLAWVLPSMMISTTVMQTILYSLMTLPFAIGFDSGMKGMMGIKNEKMKRPRIIFSFFTITAYITGVVYVAIGKLPVGILIVLMLAVVALISMIVTLIMNIKLSEDQKAHCSKLSIILLCIGLIMVVGMQFIYQYISADKVFEDITKLSGYTQAMPALVGVILLSIITVKGKTLVSIPEALKNGIPWSSMVMISAVLALSGFLTNKSSGFQSWLKYILSGMDNTLSVMVLVILAVIIILVQTNISSNIVTINLITPVIITVLGDTDVNIVVIIYMIGILSGFAFATPFSSPHITISSEMGYLRKGELLIYGLIMILLTSLVCTGTYYLGNLFIS